jgi:hypothetical protein
MKKKLTLSRTTIQVISPDRMRAVAGGALTLTTLSGTRQTECTRRVSGCNDSSSYDPNCQPETTGVSNGC